MFFDMLKDDHKDKEGMLIWTQNGFYFNLSDPIIQTNILIELDKVKKL